MHSEKQTHTRTLWPELVTFFVSLLFSLASASPSFAQDSIQVRKEDPKMVRPPVRVALQQDKTLSARHNGTPQLQLADIDPLLSLLRRTGGEIGIGLIQSRSNRTLVRLRIEVPPLPPPVPKHDGNPFLVQQQTALYEKTLQAYRNERTEWEDETNRRVEQFRRELKERLNTPSNSDRTDLWSASLQADLFLTESDITWPTRTNRWLIFISDCQNNVPFERKPLLSGARVMMVNGAGRVGSCGSTPLERFESIRSAFQYVVSSEDAPYVQ